jgi:segregation and condensation protein A
MTREADRREASNESSGERSDPRDSEDSEADRREASERSSGEERESRAPASDSEDRAGNGVTREERSDPRDSEDSEADRREASDVPLNIASHESWNREAPSENGHGPTTGNGHGPDGSLITDLSGEDAPAAMETDDDEVEPVELLVNLADDGEIDPWDIDIVAVTEEFLDRLDETDLRTGGRALFYASVLLRMKSDHLLEEPDEREEEPADPMEGFGAVDGPGVDPFDELEREMDRRLERKRARGMPQTLDELVRELRERERESFWKAHRTYDTSESPQGYARGTQTLDYRGADDFRMDDEPTVADVTGTAHGEDMEATINDVYTGLRKQYEGGRAEVLFAEIRESGGSVVETFLGLLFLAHRGQIRLQQDELFGDLWIQDPGAVTDGQEALADGGLADQGDADGE